MKLTKKALEAKVREQELEIVGLKAKLDLMMKLVPSPFVAPAPVILPPVVAPQPALPIVQPIAPFAPSYPFAPWDGTPIITCEVGLHNGPRCIGGGASILNGLPMQ